ncbi:MAG: M23 family metallopeptidase [Spirochaetia bacterium]|nr:M23 family metallopeptidase [Spirochaetia bacterium]
MKRALAVLLALTSQLGAPLAQAAPAYATYPRIYKLAPSDLVFRQIQDAIAQGYKAENAGGVYPDLFLAVWVSPGGEDLLSLAARLSLPYETLATLNGFNNPGPLVGGQLVFVPSMAGLFLPDTPRNDMDLILRPRLAEGQSQLYRISLPEAGGAFSFIPGARLGSTERSFFLNVGFRPPLSQAVLTSGYGMRKSPIDGHDRMHAGMDLAAPLGTDVFAARSGTVVAAGWDEVLGWKVVIEHDGGWRTVYGHLSRVDVELKQRVLSGMIIGAVGSTGLSTGPHLHFEIRMGEQAKDPSSFLPGIQP